MVLTIPQRRALAIVPKFSGTLSMLGSICIIYDVGFDKNKRRQSYTRMMLVMSIFDFFSSFMMFMSTWPIPKNTGPLYAVGNTHTCTLQGFVLQLGLAPPLYNAALAIYYLAVIVLSWNEKRVRMLEIVMHGVVISIVTGTAIAGLFLKLYNNSNLWCWISALPASCGNKKKMQEGICIRGENAWLYRWVFYYAILWLAILISTIAMAFVAYKVWMTDRKSFKYSSRSFQKSSEMSSENLRPGSSNFILEENASSDMGRGSQKEKPRKSRRVSSIFFQAHKRQNGVVHRTMAAKRQSLTSKVFWQSIYYLLTYYLTWVFPSTVRTQQTLGTTVKFPVLLLMSIFLPMQGFLNSFVYFRPRFLYYRKCSPKINSIRLMWMTIKRKINEVVNQSSTFGSQAASRHSASSLGTYNDDEIIDPAYALSRLALTQTLTDNDGCEDEGDGLESGHEIIDDEFNDVVLEEVNEEDESEVAKANDCSQIQEGPPPPPTAPEQPEMQQVVLEDKS